MNDAQSTIVGLKAQDCPGGGWAGMPAELEGKATVADCLTHGVCGCIYGDAVQHIERLLGETDLLNAALGCYASEQARLVASQQRLKSAIEFAHSEGFEWPTDPMAEFAVNPQGDQ